MKKKLLPLLMLVMVLIVSLLAACTQQAVESPASNDANPSDESASAELETLTLQLKWLPQSQFMGFYVADAKGYYEEEGIDIELLPGGADIIPEQQVFNGVADVGVTWVSSLLKYQEQGWPLQHVAQLFQRSGLLLVSKAETGITSSTDLSGKKVGSWFGGNEYEVFALLEANGLDRDTDLTMVQQDFTMNQLIEDRIDAASAMTYNEYGLVLAAGYEPDDLNVLNMNEEGVAMMQDCLFVSEEWISQNEDLYVRFLRASIKGWADAVADPEGAAQIVFDVDQSVSLDHQTFMAGEVAKLTVPEDFDPAMIGYTNMEAIEQTAEISLKYGLLTRKADLSEKFFTSKYWENATK